MGTPLKIPPEPSTKSLQMRVSRLGRFRLRYQGAGIGYDILYLIEWSACAGKKGGTAGAVVTLVPWRTGAFCFWRQSEDTTGNSR
jgi:hypothetical protein